MPWEQVVDESSQQVYYFNTETEEVSWDLPSDASAPYQSTEMKWTEIWDESSGKYYYYNATTAETSWDKPAEFFEPAQQTVPAVEEETSDPAVAAREWEEIFDESSGKPYYYNSKTNETSWDKPEDYVSPDIVESAPSIDLNAGEADWVEQLDPDSGKFYYYNAQTNETRWDKPVSGIALASVSVELPSAQSEEMAEDTHDMSLFSTHTVLPEEPLASLQSPSKNKFSKFINAPDEFSAEFLLSLSDSFRPSASLRDPLAQSTASTDSMLTIKELSDYTSLIDSEDSGEYSSAQSEQDLQTVMEILDKIPWGEKYREETFTTQHESLDNINSYTLELSNTILTIPSHLHSNLPAILLVAYKLHSTSLFSLYKYALLYFNYDSYLNTNNNILNSLISFQSEILTTSLTKLTNNSLQSLATECFTYIHIFCSNTTRRYDLISKLLSKLLFHPHAELIDEVYVQICKQIKNNADSSYVEYAYQLLLILLSSTPPGLLYVPYLLVFLYSQLSHHKGNVNVKRFILHCLQVLLPSLLHPPRRELPSEREIQLLLLNEPYVVPVHQIDHQTIDVAVTSFTSVTKLLAVVLDSLQVHDNNKDCFRLFEGMDTAYTLCDSSDRVVDVMSRWDRLDEPGAEKEERMGLPRHFLLKFGVYLPIVFDQVSEFILFKQCVHGMLHATIPFALMDYILLNALYLQHIFGDYISGKDYQVHFNLYRQYPQINNKYVGQLLDKLCENISKSELEHKILLYYKKLIGVNKRNAMLMFINTMQSHKLFGASYFYIVNNNINPSSSNNTGAVSVSQNEIILAITFKSIVLVDIATNAYLAEYLYSNIYNYTHSFDTFILMIGNKSNNIKYYFKTNQGQEIGDLLSIYSAYHKKREVLPTGAAGIHTNNGDFSPKAAKRESFSQ